MFAACVSTFCITGFKRKNTKQTIKRPSTHPSLFAEKLHMTHHKAIRIEPDEKVI